VHLSLQQIARALNGQIRNDQVLAPGPGHGMGDHSLSVKINDAGDDVIVYTFSPADDVMACKRYVRERCGIQSKPNGGRSCEDIAKLLHDAVASEHREPRAKPIAAYDYTDAHGKLLYQVCRYEPKRFGHRQSDGHGGWIYKGTTNRVLYRLPELIAFPDATVFICEGEKDADNVATLGLCATTVASGKWTDDCVNALAGRDCWILEDNDDSGRTKALQAAKLLHPVAKSVKIIKLPGLTQGGDISDWLDMGHTKAELEDTCCSTSDWKPESSQCSSSSESKAETEDKTTQTKILTYRRHRDANNRALQYLLKNLLPETGIGLLSGQSGTYKSFVAVKLAGAIGTGHPFAGHVVKRRGAALIFATEGAGELPIRLEALSEAEHGGKVLPVYYCDAAVRLLDKPSVASVIATAQAINDDAQREFRLPLALIIFDTVIAAAQFAKSGDENDAAVGQKLMAALGEISRATGAFVLGIDHFGKTVETGTRGTSAKEAAADVVLALLATKSQSGEVTNPRLCIRKRRFGPAAIEYQFKTKLVPLGQDEDGEPIASLAIEFAEASPLPPDQDGKWPPAAALLRRILMSLLADAGTDILPFADGPSVRAIRSDTVRAEFHRQYPTADTEPKKQQETRKKAYQRAVRAAQERGLLNVRELDGIQWIWLGTRQQ
jgi:hypothetical protein